MSLPSINFLHLTVSKIQPGQDLIGEGHYGKGQIKVTLNTYNPLTNVPTKYQLPTPYGFQDVARTIFYRSRSLQQGQINVTPWSCTPAMSLPSINILHLIVSEIWPGQDFIGEGHYKVKSRSHHDVAHLLTNVPTKYQRPTPCGFWDTAPPNFSHRPPTHPDTMGEDNTPTVIRVKIITGWGLY